MKLKDLIPLLLELVTLEQGQFEQRLLAMGIDINGKFGDANEPLLHTICRRLSEPGAEILANSELALVFQEFLLHRHKIALLIIQHPSFDPNLTDNAGDTIIHFLLSKHNHELKGIAKIIIRLPTFNPNMLNQKNLFYMEYFFNHHLTAFGNLVRRSDMDQELFEHLIQCGNLDVTCHDPNEEPLIIKVLKHIGKHSYYPKVYALLQHKSLKFCPLMAEKIFTACTSNRLPGISILKIFNLIGNKSCFEFLLDNLDHYYYIVESICQPEDIATLNDIGILLGRKDLLFLLIHHLLATKTHDEFVNMGHLLGLRGYIYANNAANPIKLEGSSQQESLFFLIQCFAAYQTIAGSQKYLVDLVLNHLRQSQMLLFCFCGSQRDEALECAAQYALELINTQGLLIPTGWTKHSITLWIHKDKLYYCNGGSCSGENAIEAYRITNPAALDFRFLIRILSSPHKDDVKILINRDMHAILGLVPLAGYSSKFQPAGNCTIHNIILGLQACMLEYTSPSDVTTTKHQLLQISAKLSSAPLLTAIAALPTIAPTNINLVLDELLFDIKYQQLCTFIQQDTNIELRQALFSRFIATACYDAQNAQLCIKFFAENTYPLTDDLILEQLRRDWILSVSAKNNCASKEHLAIHRTLMTKLNIYPYHQLISLNRRLTLFTKLMLNELSGELANIEPNIFEPIQGLTVLHIAVLNDNLELAYLLSHHTKLWVNLVDQYGKPPLYYVRSVTMANYLFASNATTANCSGILTNVINTANQDSIKLFELLLTQGVQPDENTLSVAIKSKHYLAFINLLYKYYPGHFREGCNIYFVEEFIENPSKFKNSYILSVSKRQKQLYYQSLIYINANGQITRVYITDPSLFMKNISTIADINIGESIFLPNERLRWLITTNSGHCHEKLRSDCKQTMHFVTTPEQAALMIKLGAEANPPDLSGETPIHNALKGNNPALAAAIARHPCCPTFMPMYTVKSPQYKTVAQFAAKTCFYQLSTELDQISQQKLASVTYFYEQFKPQALEKYTRLTPQQFLLVATIENDYQAVQGCILIYYQLNPSKIDPKFGTTALHAALEHNSTAIFELLLQLPNIDLLAKNSADESLFQVAVKHNNLAALKMLEQQSAVKSHDRLK